MKPARRKLTAREELAQKIATVRRTHRPLDAAFVDDDGAMHQLKGCAASHGLATGAWPCETLKFALLAERALLARGGKRKAR